MQCEVCGRKIYGKPQRVIIEGAKLTVCNECSKHGKIVWEEPTPKTATPKPKTAPQLLRTQSKKPPKMTVNTSLELIENFDLKVRQAREKLGLSHEELAKKMNEKISLLKKIETGKMTPDNKLVAKLEYALKIKLLAPTTKEKVPQTKIPKPASRKLTLGDLIQLNKKEEPAKRKRS